MTETVYAVRAWMVDGHQLDLLLFAEEAQAMEYLGTLLQPTGMPPLGFDRLAVVPRRVIGSIVERRKLRRNQ